MRWAALVLTLAGLIAATAGPGVAASSHADGPSPASIPTVVPLGSGIDAVAAALDYDLERIHRFVADEIRYEPYVGMLRNAATTLEVRAGNAVDQAVLLGALLEASGLMVRYASGPLRPGGAEALLGPVSVDRATARAIDEGAIEAGWQHFVEEVSATREDLATRPAALNERKAGELEIVLARLDRVEEDLSATMRLIDDALLASGIELSESPPTLPPSERDEHTWVQVAFGADWLDLDPSVAGSASGDTVASATITRDVLPDELRHRIEIAIDVERVGFDALETSREITFTAFADELHGRPVRLGHIGPSGAALFGEALLSSMGEGGTAYRPFVGIGSQTIVGDDDIAFRTADSAGGGGLFEDTDLLDTGGTAEPDNLAAGEAVAEWLTVSVTSPGEAPVEARRTVFDRVPAELRHGGEIRLEAIEPIELIDVAGDGRHDYAPMLATETLAVATGRTAPTVLLGPLSEPEVDALGILALAYHGLRDSLAADVGISAGVRSFAAGPNVVSYALSVEGTPDGPDYRLGVDVWHRHLGVLPLSDAETTSSRARFVAGVMTQVSERVALDLLDAQAHPSLAAGGVTAMFSQAAQAGIDTVVLRDTIPPGASYPTSASVLIEEALADGDVVVIPEAPVQIDGRLRVGWWRIDPLTGAAADVMDDGSGAGEYGQPVGNALRTAPCIATFTLGVLDIVLTYVEVVLGLTGNPGAGWAAIARLGLAIPAVVVAAACRANIAKQPPPHTPLSQRPPPPPRKLPPDPRGELPTRYIPPKPRPPNQPLVTLPHGRPRGPFGTLHYF